MDSHSKGLEYEIFINEYLNNKDNIKISYLWKDIPEDILFTYDFINSLNDTRLNRKTDKVNKLEDIGSDIVYINNSDECIIVQCKNYIVFTILLFSNDIVDICSNKSIYNKFNLTMP